MKTLIKTVPLLFIFLVNTTPAHALSEYILLYGDGGGTGTARTFSRSSVTAASTSAAARLIGEFGVLYDQFWTRNEEIVWSFHLSEWSTVTMRAIQLQDGDDNHPQLNEEALIQTPCGNHFFDDGVVAVRTRTKEFTCRLRPGTHHIYSTFAGEKVGGWPTIDTSGSYKITMEYDGPATATSTPTPRPTTTPTSTPTPRPTATPTPTNTPTPTPTPTPVPATVNASVRQNTSATCDYYASDPGTTVRYQLRNESCGYDSGVVSASNGNRTFTGLDCYGTSYRLTAEYVDTSYIFRCDGRQNNITETIFSVSPEENKQIFKVVSQLREPWIQVVGGDAYARESIAYDIPGSANGGAYFIRTSNGMAIAGNNIVIGVDGVSDSSFASESGHRDDSYVINNSSFTELRDRILSNVDNNTYNGSRPTVQDLDGNDVTILYSPNSITLSGDWNNINDVFIIYSANSIVIPNSIANDGEKRISLGSDGFLILYAQNDILVDEEIGTEDANDSETYQLEGLFMAGRNVVIGGSNNRLTDERINIYGSVVTGIENAGGTLVSYRSHEDNYLYPAVKLTYNPKLLLNAPQKIISIASSKWVEAE